MIMENQQVTQHRRSPVAAPVAAFSEGPFRLHHEPGSDWSILSADGYTMASIPDDDEFGRPDEDAANAQLFTSSAELLAELKRIRDIVAADGGSILCVAGELDSDEIDLVVARAERRL